MVKMWFSEMNCGRSRKSDAKGIQHGSEVSIINDQLAMRELYAGWVPGLLTVGYNRNPVIRLRKLYGVVQCYPEEFLRSFITVEKAWIHRNIPETKGKNKQLEMRFNVDSRQNNIIWARGKCFSTRTIEGLRTVSLSTICSGCSSQLLFFLPNVKNWLGEKGFGPSDVTIAQINSEDPDLS